MRFCAARFVGLWCLGVAACAHAVTSSPTAPPVSSAANVSQLDGHWSASFDRTHPLVGRIWDGRRREQVDAPAAWKAITEARFVLLGESHDNPDHHRLQAEVLGRVVARGRHPVVALEMIETQQQEAVERYRKGPVASASGLGLALGWNKSGWPPFADYLPIFAVAFEHHLAIAGANLSKERARAVVHQGVDALGADAVDLRIDRPFPATLEASLESELRASHCGHLPDSMLGAMALAQHARDAEMARALVSWERGDGAVLIAGAGHVRLDRGVPFYLRQRDSGATVASVAFVEVEKGLDDPAAYAARFGADQLPFDFVWFTPRADDRDPCAAFH